jgi:hypothetical protein
MDTGGASSMGIYVHIYKYISIFIYIYINKYVCRYMSTLIVIYGYKYVYKYILIYHLVVRVVRPMTSGESLPVGTRESEQVSMFTTRNIRCGDKIPTIKI